MKTNKMKKVLIALDYNDTAQKVAEEGFALAKTIGSEVILIHVILDAVNYTSTGHITIMGFAGNMDIASIPMDSVEGLKKASQHFLDKSKQHLGDDSIKTVIKEGDFAETILKAAKDLKVDVIVMGSHSQKWLENIVMGSVTEKVLRNTLIPLYIIPTKKQK